MDYSLINRLTEERNALELKLDKLKTFLLREDKTDVSAYQRDLIRVQFYHMKHYLEILDKRLEDLKI